MVYIRWGTFIAGCTTQSTNSRRVVALAGDDFCVLGDSGALGPFRALNAPQAVNALTLNTHN